MDPQSGIKTWQWVVTVIVIIILIVIGVMVFGGKGSQAPTVPEQSTTATTTDNTGALNRITMVDQYPGNVVYLSSVQLEKPGWVAIYTNNNGQPGAVIGSAHFDAGINPGKITLTQPLVDGQMYYAVLHSDDGDGVFDATKDAPLTDANGSIIMKTFRATTAAGAGLKG